MPYRRGKLFESVLNRLFAAESILIREAFTLVGDEGEGVVEQIDGAIELDGDMTHAADGLTTV
jgi:restriction system protein